MDERLKCAYEKMIMPEGCSQRIEARLREGTKPRKQRQNQAVFRPKTGWRAWGSAAALVCFAVLISLGGVLAFLGVESQWNSQNLPRFLQRTQENREEKEDVTLSEAGKKFLLTMCQAMPDWESYYVLDENFWEEFLFYSFTCPEKVIGNKAQTVMGELPFAEDTVLLSREQAEAYAFLTMGCDLPQSEEETEGSGRIWFSNGVYHIRRTEIGSRLYVFQGLDSETGGDSVARFDVYGGQPGKLLGTVRMKLRQADNENGFLIVNKTIQWEFSEEPVLQVEEQEGSLSFESVYFPTGEESFQMDIREGEACTARQIYLPRENGWVERVLSSELLYVLEDGDDGIQYRLYQVEAGSRKIVEQKTITGLRTEDGEEKTVQIPYVELDGQPYLMSNYYADGNFAVWGQDAPYWVAYQWEDTWDYTGTSEMKVVGGPWRVDVTRREMTDLWGNVPEADREDGINNNLEEIAFFRDGSFLAYAAERRNDDGTDEYQHQFLYVDPEAGQVYNLENLCGSTLDDFVGVGEEIVCWKDGQYWRIPRDTMRPEALGTLQENVVFTSGLWGGEGASFSVEKLPEGGYRIFDYLENRFLTLDSFPYEDLTEWSWENASPDGRKVMLLESGSMLIVLDCDSGKLITIPTGIQVGGSSCYVEWTKRNEISVACSQRREQWVYTLK